VKFLITGKKNASQIEETQLQHLYNLLIIYVEYLSGNLDAINVLQKIQAVQSIGANQNLPILQQEAENLLNKIDLGYPVETVQDEGLDDAAETWTPPVETVPNPDPIPPPLPLGTPSPAVVLPQHNEPSEGLQSLEEVQNELLSTLEALNMIESDLNPRSISPTDKMEALNKALDEDSDKIPTYEDIKETFSDLESIDFPDIQFGTDTSSLGPIDEFNEEDRLLNQEQQKIEFTPASLNPPPDSTRDYEEEMSSEPSFNIPTVQNLPEQEPLLSETEYKENEPVQGLNSPPGAIMQDAEFTGNGQIKFLHDIHMEEESEYNTEIKKESSTAVPLNPPSSLQDQELSPEWRNLSQSIPSPQMNPPPQKVILSQMNPPPQMNPPLQVVTIPQMNPPPQTNTPHVAEKAPDVLESEPEIPKEQSKPKLQPRPTFFNNGNGLVKPATPQVKESILRPQPSPTPEPKPKIDRVKRDRSNRIRKIICSFCGQTMTQGKKKCPNCGSFVN
jgi:hypothetical protein